MKKEVINNKGCWPVDYLRDRPHRGELEATMQKKFLAWAVKEMLDFLEAEDYMVVRKIPVVPTRTY